ncbi:FAD-binding oxidoreductase [Streptomyces sp. MAR4 CNX-425]|uniref:FAD-binding oxidoreductase n=1 Tax=Streptomyces sp. MAR4 CNX-425 TaxID=3406343 RepID=UPI003B507770
MDRRTVLRTALATAAGVGATAGLAGCSGDDGGRPDPKPTGSRTGGKTTGRTTGPADWPALAQSLDGRLVLPGDDDYRVAAQQYNTRFDDLRPAAVAYVDHAGDVAECLGFARDAGVPVSVRSGGHSYAGFSSGNGRLVLDVSALSAIDADSGTATVGAGARTIDAYEVLAARGRTIPAGSCATVGMAGLTLGGGHGVVSRAYGLTCDHLTGATVVTADGRTVECSADENEDLFWALRGAGGGNFGVVTELRYDTREAADVVAANMVWPWSKAEALLTTWQRWGPDQPDELWSAVHFGTTRGGEPTISVAALSLGTEDALHAAVDHLADQPGGPGPAEDVSIGPQTYIHAMRTYAGCAQAGREQCRLQGPVPGRNTQGILQRDTFAARSDFYDEPLDANGVGTLLDRAEKASRAADALFILTALGGAVNRVPVADTAFVHRGSRVLAQYISSWDEGADGGPGERWLADTHAAMRQHASGAAYQNYTDAGLRKWRRAYYGPAAERLAKVKERYDPERLFDFDQAV